MTIQEAEQHYTELVSSSQMPFTKLLDQLISDRYSEDIQNDSHLDALVLTHHLLQHVFHSLCILTSASGDVFLKTLEVPFRQALRQISQNNGKCRVILIGTEGDQPTPTPFLDQLRIDFPHVFDFARGKSSSNVQHFIVGDGRKIRIEELHPPLTPDSPASQVKARVNFNDRVIGEARQALFDNVWSKLTPQT